MTDIGLLLSIGKVLPFTKNQTVFMQNDEGDNMYIVLKGEFGVYINSFNDFPLRVAGIQVESFFGEMSVIDGWPRSATIIAEEESAALVIEKENFGVLLEKAPDIATAMMDTLRSRAQATADEVRKTGKEVKELPPLLRVVQFRDAKSSLTFMVMLAERIREMNKLLTEPEKESETPPAAACAEAGAAGTLLRLLPEGHPPFNLADTNDNRGMLRNHDFVCPYCGEGTVGYIPIFSALKKKDTGLDGRVSYEGFDILRYTNIVCSNCCYTDTYQEFGRPHKRIVNESCRGNQFENEEGFTGYDKTHSHSVSEALKSYYLHLACLARTTTDPLRFAKAWLRLYWLYCDRGSEDLALQSASHAARYYEAHLEDGSEGISPKDRMNLHIVLGELALALGDSGKAKVYYKENVDMGRKYDETLYRQSLSRYNEIR